MADFEALVDAALASLPPQLREQISNVEFLVEDEPPDGEDDLYGLYEGVPLGERGSGYAGALPDRITIFRGPLEHDFGHDPALLAEEVRVTVLHELAHHFGIDDDRLLEIDRY